MARFCKGILEECHKFDRPKIEPCKVTIKISKVQELYVWMRWTLMLLLTSQTRIVQSLNLKIVHRFRSSK